MDLDAFKKQLAPDAAAAPKNGAAPKPKRSAFDEFAEAAGIAPDKRAKARAAFAAAVDEYLDDDGDD